MWSTVVSYHQIPHDNGVGVGGKCLFIIFNTSATEPILKVECPMLIPDLSLGSHLVSPSIHPCRGSPITNYGKSQVWNSFAKKWNSTPVNLCSGVLLSSSISSLLYLWNAASNKKIHSMVLAASVHSLMEWRRRVWFPRVNSLILNSTIEFWWGYPTPQ